MALKLLEIKLVEALMRKGRFQGALTNVTVKGISDPLSQYSYIERF